MSSNNSSTIKKNNVPTEKLSRKEIHHDFFANKNGTNVNEICIMSTLPILLQLLSLIIGILTFQLTGIDLKGNFFLNFLAVIVPYVTFVTFLNEYLLEVYIVIVALCLLLILNSIVLSTGSKFIPKLRISNHLSNGKMGLLSVSRFRGTILILTAISILAADLKIFPRRFVKTELMGISPMDLGVGFYAFVGGLLGGCGWSSTGALVVLGLCRLAVLKLMDYPERESEYGRHWNFLFTIAVIRVFGWSVKFIRQSMTRTVILTMVLVILQNYLFTQHGLYSWALSDPAPSDSSFVSLNRQGLVSLLGFSVIWVMGSAARVVMDRRGYYLVIPVMLSAMGVTMVQLEMVEVSRRSANLGYVIWTVAMSCWQLLLLVVVDCIVNWLEDRSNYVTEVHHPDLFSKANKYAFSYFLLVNLQTGLANQMFDTHRMSNCCAYSLLIGHMFSSLTIVTGLEKLSEFCSKTMSSCKQNLIKSKTV